MKRENSKPNFHICFVYSVVVECFRLVLCWHSHFLSLFFTRFIFFSFYFCRSVLRKHETNGNEMSTLKTTSAKCVCAHFYRFAENRDFFGQQWLLKKPVTVLFYIPFLFTSIPFSFKLSVGILYFSSFHISTSFGSNGNRILREIVCHITHYGSRCMALKIVEKVTRKLFAIIMRVVIKIDKQNTTLNNTKIQPIWTMCRNAARNTQHKSIESIYYKNMWERIDQSLIEKENNNHKDTRAPNTRAHDWTNRKKKSRIVK